METNLLDAVLNRQMSVEQIEVLEELLTALERIDGTDINEAFKAEAPNHKVFDICYEEDTSSLIKRVEDEFPNLEGYIEQLSCTDYCTDHDKYSSTQEEQEAKKQLLDKIENWKSSVDLFIDNVYGMY